MKEERTEQRGTIGMSARGMLHRRRGQLNKCISAASTRSPARPVGKTSTRGVNISQKGSPTRAPSLRRYQAGHLSPQITGQSGRSMAEMLAVLAIMGVLTVGGIAAYSFAVSKHRANQIYNQVDLRAVTSFSNPFVRQATTGQTYPLAGFDEVVEGITYQHKKTTGNGYDIIASHVPERVCRRLQDMTFPVPKSVTLNGADLSSTCGSDNTFVFSYNGLSVGKPSSGGDPIDCTCSGCQSCESGVCRDNDNLCKPKEICQSGSCVCAPGYTECGGSCYTTCADGFMRDPISCDCVCEPQACPEHASWDSSTCACVCPTLPLPTECQEITTVEEGCDQITNLPDGTECSTGICLEGACCNPDDSQACCEASGKTWQEATQKCCGKLDTPTECQEIISQDNACDQITNLPDGTECSTGICLEGACCNPDDSQACCEASGKTWQEATQKCCGKLDTPTECQEIISQDNACDQITNLPDGTECSTGICLEGACCNPDDSQACCEASGKTWLKATQTCEAVCVYRYTNPVGAIGSDCQVTGYVNPIGSIKPTCQITGFVNPTKAYETPPDLNTSSCPSGQYCRVAWTRENCSGTINSKGASTMYGVCEQMTSNGGSCKQGVHLGDLNITSCPSGQYCRVAWTSESCSGRLGSTGASTMYGVCEQMTSSSGSCKQNVHLTDTYLREETGCSSGMYCLLTSSTEDYTGSLSSTGSDPMYGVCLSMDSTS